MISGSKGERMWTASAVGRAGAAVGRGAVGPEAGAAVDLDRDEAAGFDAGGDGGFARRVEVADRIEADDGLGAQGTVEQVVEDLAFGGGAGWLFPAEMPVGEVVGLEHAVATADREIAGEETEFEGALRRLGAGPGVVFRHARVVVDVADRERAVAADPGEDASQIGRRDGAEAAGRALRWRFMSARKKR